MPKPIPPEPWWLRFRVELPAWSEGPWRMGSKVQPFFLPSHPEPVSKTGRPMPPIWPGLYTHLERFDMCVVKAAEGSPYPDAWYGRKVWKTWMSDAPNEIFEQLHAIERLQGCVLIGGLGLGVMVKAALENPKVTRVVVVEIDSIIMRQIGPHYRDPRLTIIHRDAMKVRPRHFASRFDVVWMDIWRDIDAKNIPSMIELAERWRPRCGWFGSWGAEYCLEKLVNNDFKTLDPELVGYMEKALGVKAGVCPHEAGFREWVAPYLEPEAAHA